MVPLESFCFLALLIKFALLSFVGFGVLLKAGRVHRTFWGAILRLHLG